MLSDSFAAKRFVLCVVVATAGACTMDFDSFRRGWEDAGPDERPNVRRDVVPTDEGLDASEPSDATVDTAPSDVTAPAVDVVAEAAVDATPLDVALVDAPRDVQVVDAPRDVQVVDVPTVDVALDAPGDASGGDCGRVLINEVQVGGASAADEFVEFYNPTACALDLSNFALRYRSASGTSDTEIWRGSAGQTIAAGGYFTIANPAMVDSLPAPATPFTRGGTTGFLSSTGGGLGVFPTTTAEAPSDRVGYGAMTTNAYVAGSPAAAPPNGSSIARRPNGRNTNDNAGDFAVTAAPTPGRANVF